MNDSAFEWGLPPFALKGLVPLYRLGLSLHRKIVRPRRLPVPVVSLGNLTVGGTGKTPAVIHLANELSSLGKKVAILSRGYGRASREDVIVSSGGVVLAGILETGDEPQVIASRCRGAIVAVGSRRDRLGTKVLSRKKNPVDVILLDDGFQHWRLARDLDIVLIDGRTSLFAEKLLPVGRLREPLSSLKRAHAYVLTHVEDLDLANAFREILKEKNGEKPILFSRPRFGSITDLATGGERDLHGKRVLAVSGLARPGGFERMLAESGAAEIHPLRFTDHHKYSKADVLSILESSRRTDLIVTTEKDAVKLREYGIPRLAVAALEIEYLPEGDLSSPVELMKGLLGL